MDCAACREQLSAFQAGDLDAGERRAVETYLAGCAACRSEQASYGRLDTLVTSLPRRAPAADTVTTILNAAAAAAPVPARKTEFGPVLNLDDLAEYLRVPRTTVEECLDELPAFEFGGRLLFRRASIDAWIAEREQSFAFQRTGSQINAILTSGD
ncbi:MAG: helix-turn-helix domain-containing protein [Planctomycetota bacterium]